MSLTTKNSGRASVNIGRQQPINGDTFSRNKGKIAELLE